MWCSLFNANLHFKIGRRASCVNMIGGGLDGVHEKTHLWWHAHQLLSFIDSMPTCWHVHMLMHMLFQTQMRIVFCVYVSFSMCSTWTQRNMSFMSWTPDTFHLDRSPLNDVTQTNTALTSSTLDTSLFRWVTVTSPPPCLVVVFGVRMVELPSLVLAWGTFLRQIHVGELLQDFFFGKTIRGTGFPDASLNLLSFLFVKFVVLLYRLWLIQCHWLFLHLFTYDFFWSSGWLAREHTTCDCLPFWIWGCRRVVIQCRCLFTHTFGTSWLLSLTSLLWCVWLFPSSSGVSLSLITLSSTSVSKPSELSHFTFT